DRSPRPMFRPALHAAPPTCPLPAAGQILLLTGPSGSGKTTLLRAIHKQAAKLDDARPWIDLALLSAPNRALINCLRHSELRDAMHLLAGVGLAEASLLLKSARFLSEGQHFRLRVAMGLERAQRERAGCLLVCDEFAAPLDDVTAATVAMTIRRAVDVKSGIAMILATGRESLAGALAPDIIARCDFGTIAVTTSTTQSK
ncbi:MAG TPA: AAA family ATPase, partial [Tepidisphaeraceae bacterium]|nr:AAA family ATPase [Tepidisphaeraceae bacterium]